MQIATRSLSLSPASSTGSTGQAGTSAAAKDVGLAAISDSWIPMGDSTGKVSASGMSDTVHIHRDANQIRVQADDYGADLVATNLGQGQVGIKVDLPWPFHGQSEKGTLVPRGDKLHLSNPGDNRSADIWRLADGRLEVAFHRPGKSDRDVLLRVNTPT